LHEALLKDADTRHANIHRIREQNTNWDQARRDGIRETDPDLADAEDWRPPQKTSTKS